MSSAAKLRTAGRTTAVLASAAIVMTSFGPTAFAWEAPGSATKDAKSASIGIVDADVATAGTQGAKAVVAGQSDQPVADIELVVPATYQAGDYIDLSLPQQTDPAARATWSSVPTVTPAGPFKAETAVATTSAAGGSTGNAAQRKAEDFVPATGETSPQMPSITPTVVSGPYGDRVIRLTFNTTADASQWNAKFAMTVSGLKVNLGEKVGPGEVLVTADSFNKGGTASDIFPATQVTAPAAVTTASISAAGASLVDEQTPQALGDITVRAASGAFGAGNLTLSVTNATLATDQATVTFYDAAGAAIGEPVKQAATASGLDVPDASVPDTAVRAVVSGLLATPTAGQTKATVTLSKAGALTPSTANLTGASQTDIEAPAAGASVDFGIVARAARLSGLSRYDTALQVANQYVADNDGAEVDNLVIASGESFPDALSASYLAQVKSAPVVLTQKGQVPPAVLDFIREHGVKRVFLVGGTGAVTEAAATQIASQTATDYVTTPSAGYVTTDAKVQVTRLSGANRFATNQAVNAYAAANGAINTTVPMYGSASAKTAIVVNGMTPWDALPAGALVAGGTGGGGLPIILTDGKASMPAEAVNQLRGFGIGHALFVGGTGVLPSSVETQAAGLGAKVTRLAGGNRFATNAAVADFAHRSAAGSSTNTQPGLGYVGSTALLANGGFDADGTVNATKWADALAAGPLAAKNQAALYLAMPEKLPTEIKASLVKNTATLTTVTPLGGAASVSDAVVAEANAQVK